jgi:Cytochrome P460
MAGVVPDWHHRVVRTKVIALVAVAAFASAVVVVASARTTANGLPAYTDGWQKWPKINRKPFTSTGPLSSAHSGRKNVYASKRKVRGKYPNGTVIVKTIVKPGTRFVGQFAVMRKVKGRWRYIEYERSSARARYALLAQGALCSSCHAQARASDYVFTKR